MNRLSELRKSHKLTQIQIADMLGVTQQTIFAWEHGKALPLMDNAIKLSSFYGVSIDYLLGRDDTTKKQPIDEDGLLAKTLSRVQTLSDPFSILLLLPAGTFPHVFARYCYLNT